MKRHEILLEQIVQFNSEYDYFDIFLKFICLITATVCANIFSEGELFNLYAHTVAIMRLNHSQKHLSLKKKAKAKKKSKQKTKQNNPPPPPPPTPPPPPKKTPTNKQTPQQQQQKSKQNRKTPIHCLNVTRQLFSHIWSDPFISKLSITEEVISANMDNTMQTI